MYNLPLVKINRDEIVSPTLFIKCNGVEMTLNARPSMLDPDQASPLHQTPLQQQAQRSFVADAADTGGPTTGRSGRS